MTIQLFVQIFIETFLPHINIYICSYFYRHLFEVKNEIDPFVLLEVIYFFVPCFMGIYQLFDILEFLPIKVYFELCCVCYILAYYVVT